MPITVRQLGQEFTLVPVRDTTQVLTGLELALKSGDPGQNALFMTVLPVPLEAVHARFATGFFLELARFFVECPLPDLLASLRRSSRSKARYLFGIAVSTQGFKTDFYCDMPLVLSADGLSDEELKVAYLNLARVTLGVLVRRIAEKGTGQNGSAKG